MPRSSKNKSSFFLDVVAGYSNFFGHATWTASTRDSYRTFDVAHRKDRGVNTKPAILQEKDKQTDPNRPDQRQIIGM